MLTLGNVSHLQMAQKKFSCGSSSFGIAEKLHTDSTTGRKRRRTISSDRDRIDIINKTTKDADNWRAKEAFRTHWPTFEWDVEKGRRETCFSEINIRHCKRDFSAERMWILMAIIGGQTLHKIGQRFAKDWRWTTYWTWSHRSSFPLYTCKTRHLLCGGCNIQKTDEQKKEQKDTGRQEGGREYIFSRRRYSAGTSVSRGNTATNTMRHENSYVWLGPHHWAICRLIPMSRCIAIVPKYRLERWWHAIAAM